MTLTVAEPSPWYPEHILLHDPLLLHILARNPGLGEGTYSEKR